MTIEVVDLSGNGRYVPPRGHDASPSGVKLRQTLTADGASTVIRIGGKFNIIATGSFGSGTIAVQKRVNGTWATIGRDSANNLAEYTGAFSLSVSDPETSEYRFNLSGSSSPQIAVEMRTTPRDSLGSA